ncbi:MAG: SEC-C metal-binding domain-containing protein [Candidatus Omnitrophota bacterium]
MKNKIGRNDPCPCGSEKKYKKCCMGKQPPENKFDIPLEVKLQFEKMQAIQAQIKKQQGLGRPIISYVHKGYRFVSSGSKLHWNKVEKWQTFHDFLSYYIPHIFGKEWGEGELKKFPKDQHPIIQWYEKLAAHKREHRVEGANIQSAPMTGAAFAILSLAHNLFLLEHNVKVQEKLIKRLKSSDKGTFQGALYETYVVAIFIRAGFKIKMEDEDDPSKSHGEFIATAPHSSTQYLVEAKARLPFKEHVGIGKQLGKALQKKTSHKRIVFIDVNIPKLMEKIDTIDQELRDRELSQDDDWKNAPAAYVFITNHSFTYDLGGVQFERMGFAYGFKIDYFKGNTAYTSLRDARMARDKHMDMVRLIRSIREHNEIPVTFDGDIPEFVFNKELQEKRLLIGSKYLLPGKDGKNVVGILESATISEHEKLAYGSYLLEDGTRGIITCLVSDEEIAAYKKYPDTFFGVPRQQGKKIDDPLELYDFFYESYKKTPKEKLLDFMKNAPDIEELKKLSEEELRVRYCEGVVYSAMRDKVKTQPS